MGRKTSTVRFEDGEPIPRKMIEEVVAIQQRIMIPIVWQKGDFAMIDNTSALHGRRAFKDPDGEVFLRMVKNIEF